MTSMMICLFIAILLPIVSKAPLAMAMNREGGYNNRYPRQQQAKLTGFGARARAAHENAFEALIMFAPALLAAVVTQQTGDLAQTLAITFVVARIAYLVCYLADIHWLRSLVWAAGYLCTLGLVILAIS